MILKLKNFWWILTNVHKLAMISQNAPMVEVVTQVFKFVEQTAKEGRPRLCKIAMINTGDGTKLGDFVTLWAGAHDGNPLERLEGVLAQRDALKEVVNNFIEKFPEEERAKYKFLVDQMN